MSVMKNVRYVCTHCGRKFEAEEKEILECPGCFWSTSVKREDDTAASVLPAHNAAAPRKSGKRPVWVVWLVVGLIVLLAGLRAIKPVARQIRGINRGPKAVDIRPEKENAPSAALTPAGTFEGLSEEERNILARKVELEAERSVSPEEQAALQARAPIQTGMIERLPSQTWTLESFKEMLANQEKTFKVPLPRSYKNKLETLFKEKYLPGVEAFHSGDLLKARDSWIESLAFPQYSNDIARHRGVALTMLRPFINDTLSKIGAINSSLVEGKIRAKEQSLVEQYAKLLDLLNQKAWPEASAVILEMEKMMDELERPEELAGSAPPYPRAAVDAGIAGTLAEIAAPPAPAVADTGAVRADIRTKRGIIDSFIGSNLDAMQAPYLEALDEINKKNWREARKKLRQIDPPPALRKDASEKLKILERLDQTALDSGAKSG